MYPIIIKLDFFFLEMEYIWGPLHMSFAFFKSSGTNSVIRVHYSHYLNNLMKKYKTFESRIQFHETFETSKKFGHINSNVIFITILTPMSTWLTLGWSSCISLVAREKPFDDKP